MAHNARSIAFGAALTRFLNTALHVSAADSADFVEATMTFLDDSVTNTARLGVVSNNLTAVQAVVAPSAQGVKADPLAASVTPPTAN